MNCIFQTRNDRFLLSHRLLIFVSIRPRPEWEPDTLSPGLLASVLTKNLSSLLYSLGQGVEDRLSVLPANACIRDAYTVLQARLTLSGHFLVA